LAKVKNSIFKNVQAVLWDWNGTLLNDLEISIRAMNDMLMKRNIPGLSVDRYREIFTFPVKDYYVKAGVNFSTYEWDEVAMEFIHNFRKYVPEAALNPMAKQALQFLDGKGIRQFILSAMEQEFLTETVNERLAPGTFEEIVGLNNHYAHTKIENAGLLVEKLNLPVENILMIGDTIHDLEVAKAAGIKCILFSGGHQPRQRLETTGAEIIDDLSEIRGLF
jgi:phosphoglycolate phosphatase